jgi:hypothetical protein
VRNRNHVNSQTRACVGRLVLKHDGRASRSVVDDTTTFLAGSQQRSSARRASIRPLRSEDWAPANPAWAGRSRSVSSPRRHSTITVRIRRGSRRLAGKAAIVTDGDSGIRRAVAIAFAREHWMKLRRKSACRFDPLRRKGCGRSTLRAGQPAKQDCRGGIPDGIAG